MTAEYTFLYDINKVCVLVAGFSLLCKCFNMHLSKLTQITFYIQIMTYGHQVREFKNVKICICARVNTNT